MKNYIVVSGSDLGRFEEKINNLLDLGYVLIGGIASVNTNPGTIVIQAMAQPTEKGAG